MRRSPLARAAALAAALAVAACAGGQRRAEDDLADARREQRELFDRLYEAYGGSEVSAGTSTGPLGHVFGEADRSYFERSCIAHGRGERPVNLSPRMQKFLDQPESQKECWRASDLQRRIDELSRRVAAG
jgi:hypothetical protein